MDAGRRREVGRIEDFLFSNGKRFLFQNIYYESNDGPKFVSLVGRKTWQQPADAVLCPGPLGDRAFGVLALSAALVKVFDEEG